MKKRIYVVALAVALALPAGLVFADTQEPQNHPRPCQDDVQKFCSQVAPGSGDVVRCLKDHEQKLSGSCKAALDRTVRRRGRLQPPVPVPEPK